MIVYMVMGGLLSNVQDIRTLNSSSVEFVGFFDNEETAHAAWRDFSQRNVDQAHKRYFILPIDISTLQTPSEL